MYTCPMHHEVRQEKPGKCPKCGMKLVEESLVTTSAADTSMENSYRPLITIFVILLASTFVLSLRDVWSGIFLLSKPISYFMIGFFLVFSGFKLIDIKGFAEGYFTYDLLAQRVFAYGYIYPFIELFFGFLMILFPTSVLLLWTEFIVMVFSGIGVLIKLLRHEKFQCACLGTFLKVPLTKVTLIEDFGMAFLALLLLLLK